VFGHGFRAAPASAAFVNGTAAHTLDFDASFSIGGQPMAGLTAAVLALAEPLGVSGQGAIEAYVTGYEVAGTLAWCLASRETESPWHSTATVGSFGCTAAAARLLGLDEDQTCMALGITSSMASGVVSNFGTMSKPLHAGLAARNGVLAATLAQRGFSGNPLSLEEQGGFLGAFVQPSVPNLKPLDELGSAFAIERGVRFKAYPCGGLTHSAIDAVLALRAEHQIAGDSIERIDVRVTAFTAERIVYRIPQTELQAKFSMAYILARAALDGAVTIPMFSDEAIAEPRVLALAERIFMEADPSLEGARTRPSVVAIALKDGRTFSRRVDSPKGSPESPMSPDELRGKFRACASLVLGEKAAAEALETLDDLETVPNVASLSRLLMGRG
jgi:2-methylcitrate dehydratase PrpD